MCAEQTTKKQYVDPNEMREEYSKSVLKGSPTEKLFKMIEKIAKNFSKTFNYINKIDKDACVNYAIAEAIFKWNKYDSSVSENIFSFFTTMISNDMKLHWNNLNKNSDRNISIDALFAGDKDK